MLSKPDRVIGCPDSSHSTPIVLLIETFISNLNKHVMSSRLVSTQAVPLKSLKIISLILQIFQLLLLWEESRALTYVGKSSTDYGNILVRVFFFRVSLEEFFQSTIMYVTLLTFSLTIIKSKCCWTERQPNFTKEHNVYLTWGYLYRIYYEQNTEQWTNTERVTWWIFNFSMSLRRMNNILDFHTISRNIVVVIPLS